MPAVYTYRIHFLGDDALLIDFGNQIDIDLNDYIVQLSKEIKRRCIAGVKELVVAYASLALYVDAWQGRKVKGEAFLQDLRTEVRTLIDEFQPSGKRATADTIRIPVCYEEPFAPDLDNLAKANEIDMEEVIRLHSQTTYHVFMIGFLPGFAYMGEVDERIVLGRKPEPVPILPGSVGIAGKQTGIYPLSSPGGWNIIGRTPLQIFKPQDKTPCLLKAGDQVSFYPISANEFENY